jgi:ABC-type transport system involved in multi-copper enzyme maturation permease subunit
VFGGIEWRLVLATVSITLCAALFSATVSLTFSVFHKRAYVAILMTFAVLFGLYAVLPLVIGFLTDFSESAMIVSLKFTNPFAVLQMVVMEAIAPGMVSRTLGDTYWYIHCAIMLGLTSLLVILSASFVRRAALRQAAGEAVVQFGRKGRRGKAAMTARPAPAAAEGAGQLPVASAVPASGKTRRTRRVSDRPVLWRELHVPMLATTWRKIILVVFILFALAMTYLAAASERALDDEGTHILYGFTFLLVTLVGTVVVSATTITTEKEARTWELLLTTPLKARSILFGKAMGVLRRLTPTAALFLGHVVLFTIVGIIHPLGILHTLLLLAGPMIFLIGTGTYLSLRLKRTTTAVMTNLAVALFLWAALPFLAVLMDEAIGMGDELLDPIAAINPFALTGFSFMGTVNRWYESPFSMDFDWPSGGGDLSGVEFTLALAGISVGYALAGVGLLAAAAARFRTMTRE